MADKMIYRVATNPGDYSQCHQLMRDEGVERPDLPLTFPTILAIENLKLVGFIATRLYDQKVIAGPLVVRSDRRRIFTAIRLLEHYETAMRNLGIRHVIFTAETEGFIEKAIQRLFPELSPYKVRDGRSYYLWEMSRGKRAA